MKAYYAKNRKAWRAWLEKNGEKEKSVWLIIYKKEAAKPSTTYPVAVEEALCFGWIDSKVGKKRYFGMDTKRQERRNQNKAYS